MNRVERHYRLGGLEGRVYAINKIIEIINKEVAKLPDDNIGKMYLRAVRGDIYEMKSEAVSNYEDWKRSVANQDAIEDAIDAKNNKGDS